MKVHTRELLESGRPKQTPAETIGYCLERLFEDRDHLLSDEVVKGLQFEELIGALLQARDLASIERGSALPCVREGVGPLGWGKGAPAILGHPQRKEKHHGR